MEADKYSYIERNKFIGLLFLHYGVVYGEIEWKENEKEGKETEKEGKEKECPKDMYLRLKKTNPNYHTTYGPQSYI